MGNKWESEMEAFKLFLRALGYLILFFIPAGYRFWEMIVDRDWGPYYVGIVTTSIGASLFTITVSMLIIVTKAPSELWFLPALTWPLSWMLFLEVKRFSDC